MFILQRSKHFKSTQHHDEMYITKLLHHKAQGFLSLLKYKHT